MLCGQPSGGPGEDECAAAAKLLAEAIATADGLGTFSDTGGGGEASGGGGDLDRTVCEWMSLTLTRALGGQGEAGHASYAEEGGVLQAAGTGAAGDKCAEQVGSPEAQAGLFASSCPPARLHTSPRIVGCRTAFYCRLQDPLWSVAGPPSIVGCMGAAVYGG